MKLVSPRAAALRILAARAEAWGTPFDTSYPLADFQRDGVARAHAILRERGGVIIADGVGLGKTFMAAALIEHAIHRGTVAVVVPASVKRMWRDALRRIPDTITLVSHGQLSRGRAPPIAPTLVVVDEAHAFRNPATRRYRALQIFCRSAQVVLLTATPVNNSLRDLHYQLRLFAGDDAFRDLGIPSLRVLLTSDEPAASDLARLHRAVIVRRTSAQVRADPRGIAVPSGPPLRFPDEVALKTLIHPPLAAVSDIVALLERLSFAAYPNETSRVLLEISLLKRFQSGRHAAIASLSRLISFNARFLRAIAEGRFLQPRTLPRLTDDQLWMDELVLPEIPRAVNADLLVERVRADVSELRAFRAKLVCREDEKMRLLVHLLTVRTTPAPTLVFSEFRDTAEALARTLAARFRVGLITGKTARIGTEKAGRSDVIRRFAPLAHHAPQPPPAERIDVLIATDVLAEGLNLQDADAVISYDLPWNPVRLIQRAGRIDRIGSPHNRVFIYNFLPDRNLDDLIGLIRRLRTKLRDVRRSVGHETAILEADELSEEFIKALAREDPSVLVGGPLPPSLDLQYSPDEAGPMGCVAAVGSNPRRILACFQSKLGIRDLIWDGQTTMADISAVDAILVKAVEHKEVCPFPDAGAIIARCHGYLESRKHIPGSDSATQRLARAIQYAVMAYGIAAPAALLDSADATLAVIGSCTDPTLARLRIRAASTPEGLLNALQEARDRCRPNSTETLKWQLVAAIATD